MQTHEPFRVRLGVRDYEIDMQGVVNNAVYQNYLEHARHEFLKARGVDFAALALCGVNLVVTRIEMDFLGSLRSGDMFDVTVAMERISRLRFGFRQTIATADPDSRPIMRAVAIGTALNQQGRPKLPAQIERLLAQASAPSG